MHLIQITAIEVNASAIVCAVLLDGANLAVPALPLTASQSDVYGAVVSAASAQIAGSTAASFRVVMPCLL